MILQPPSRDFGYFVGDLVVSKSVIIVGPDTLLDAGSLPYAGPVSTSIDLRDVQVWRAPVPGGSRIVIRTEYQTFAAPEEVSRVDIPGYQLSFTQRGTRLTVAVPGFDIGVSPFRHDLQPVLDPAVLRPDPPFARIGTERARAETICGGAAAVVAACWLAAEQGWLPWHRRRRTPFADAARRLRRCSGHEALLLLHRAFDDTAGERVLAEDLARFLTRHPRFVPLRADIEQFYAHSRAVFFAAITDGRAFDALRLCRALARVERR